MNLRKLGNYFILSGLILIPTFIVLIDYELIQNLAVSIISSLIAVLMFFLGFAFRYFNSEDKIRKRFTYWIFGISILLIYSALNFKLNHWRGAGFLIITGILMFTFTALPLMVKIRYEKWKSFTTNRIHTLIVCIADLLSIMAVTLGILFKVQKYPGANLLFTSGVILFVISFFAWNIIFKRSLRKSRESEIKLADTLKELKSKHEIIEEKNKEITDSINYAQRIQSALLPSESDLKNEFNESFILFKPKDIVSGDFYWMAKTEQYFFYATADCTGHGVPGGFMSMLGSSFLNEIVLEKKIHEPGKILDLLREKVISALKQTGNPGENKDGMDLVLIRISKDHQKLMYSAANNEFYILRKNEMYFYKPDKQPIGFYGDQQKPFSQFEIDLNPNDVIYTFTDGYADQFGGEKGKKLKYKNLEKLLLENHLSTFHQQKEKYDAFIENWKGSLEQNDDICIIGIKV